MWSVPEGAASAAAEREAAEMLSDIEQRDAHARPSLCGSEQVLVDPDGGTADKAAAAAARRALNFPMS